MSLTAIALAASLSACASGGAHQAAAGPQEPAPEGALVGPNPVPPYVVARNTAPAAAAVHPIVPVSPPITGPQSTIHPGDTLRVTRDFTGDQQTFVVQPDGRFFYPLAGPIDTTGKTPEQVSAELFKALIGTLSSPQVTVNILASPSNRIYVGGDVRTPGFLDLTGGLNLHQAVLMAGGLLDTADEDLIAVARYNLATTRYDVYFVSFADMFDDAPDRRESFALQRDDIIFAPKSSVGSAIETVDLFLNRLLPFGRGVGLNYVYTR